ncbi:MAG: hypothetical protein P8P36_04265 [Akkermansiaceae bacterium]|nr:hypothetical protein [Akkermansiaceae bacterium]
MSNQETRAGQRVIIADTPSAEYGCRPQHIINRQIIFFHIGHASGQVLGINQLPDDFTIGNVEA